MNPFVPEGPETGKPGVYARFRARVTDLLSHVPLRTRITALVMIAVGASVALASIAAWVTVRNQILSQLDNGLLDHARNTATLRRAQEIADMEANNFSGQGQNTTNITFVVFDGEMTLFGLHGDPQSLASGKPVIPPDPADLQLLTATKDSYRFKTVHTGDGVRLRAVTVPVPLMINDSSSTAGNGEAITLAESTADTQQTLNRLTLVSLLVGIAGIAVAGSAGITVARTGLRPVDRLTEATEHVARTGDLRPIEVQGTDELARLAASFNAMLTALSRSQEHQRRLIADAGHELRTPLTSMRTNIDLLSQVFGSGAAASAKISDADRAELIADVRAQMEELSVLVGDLVELSRDVKPPAAPEPVNLADVVRQAVDRVRRRAPHVHFDIQLDPWFLDGDPATLERAVTNLLDNAAKWSPEDGTVTVHLKDGLLQVSDEGPGIADADLPHVFERFYRSTEARTMPGSGLGLAIVRQAAENHGGRVAAARAPGGGALLGLWLPGQPSEDAADDAEATTGA